MTLRQGLAIDRSKVWLVYPHLGLAPRFNRDWEQLSKQEQARFRAAPVVFVADLAAGTGFRPGLRVKKMAGHDIGEMTWAPDGRATFSYGPPVRDGDVHIIWRRVGSHQIARQLGPDRWRSEVQAMS